MNSPPRSRRLVAVVAADVAGYSRLMGQDEEQTLRQLKAARVEVVDPRIEEYGGRVIGTAGDSWLAEFASAVDAIRCALGVQEAMHARARGDPPDRQFLFRIGINLGDVMVDGDQLYGDGVNIAARLESAADPGGILVSAAVREQLHGSVLAVQFEDRGSAMFKNIDHPVQVFRVRLPHEAGAGIQTKAPPSAARRRLQPRYVAVAALLVLLLAVAGTALHLFFQRDATEVRLVDRRAIAVMPFVNQSGDSAQDYLGEALTEDVTAALGRFPSLLVMAPSATRAFRGQSSPLREVATRLQVRYVVEGSVRRVGEGLRVNAQLTDAEQGTLLWSERYEVASAEVMSIPDTIVRSIAGLLAARLERFESELAMRKPLASLEAHDQVLRARHLMRQATRAGHIQARQLLQSAIAADPDLSEAKLALAEVLYDYTQLGYTGSPGELADEAERLARAVLAREPHNGRAHGILGNLLSTRGQYAEALREIDEAIRANPSDHKSLRNRASVLLWTGRFKAATEAFDASRRFDPTHTPGTLFMAALAHLMAGEADRARELLETPAHRDSEFVFLQVALAMAYADLGRAVDAAEAAARVKRRAPFFDASEFGSRFQRAEDRQRVADLLQKAGLLEGAPPSKTG